jgi:hypothetical protein
MKTQSVPKGCAGRKPRVKLSQSQQLSRRERSEGGAQPKQMNRTLTADCADGRR